MDKLIMEHQHLLAQHEPVARPKQWTECTFDERFDYIESLRGLYLQNGLAEAKINL